MSAFVNLLALLVVAHALCDYPLQGDFLARAKNPENPIPGVWWGWAMGAHCAIHGGAVGLLTGSAWLGVAEAVMHWLADWGKCQRLLSFSWDQCLHLCCKVAWAALAVWGALPN